MQKVSGLTIQVVFAPLLLLAASVFFWFQRHKGGLLMFLCVISIVGFILSLLYFTRVFLAPLYAYDEKGICLLNSKGEQYKNYTWAEVEMIQDLSNSAYRPSSSFVNVPVPSYSIVMKDTRPINIGVMVTRDYSKVLSDIVQHVRKNNPGARIDPGVLEKIAD